MSLSTRIIHINIYDIPESLLQGISCHVLRGVSLSSVLLKFFPSSQQVLTTAQPNSESSRPRQLMSLCTRILHIYVYDTTEFDGQEISWHVAAECR